jgi:hypothetical protein
MLALLLRRCYGSETGHLVSIWRFERSVVIEEPHFNLLLRGSDWAVQHENWLLVAAALCLLLYGH